MSSLIYFIDKSQVLVATDTLAVSYDEHAPFMFTTKAFIVPHLKMIMCGTGAAGFCGEWFIKVNHNMVVRDIDHLDYHTPDNLSALWAEFKKKFSPLDTTTTVYYFGFSAEDSCLHAYAYRSTSDFKSERLQYGLGLKPECTPTNTSDFLEDIKKMMREQRQLQANKPKEERLYIGGEIQIHHLGKKGFNVFTLDRFEDFETYQTAIYENYEKHSC